MNPLSVKGLHPALARWFAGRFPSLAGIQKKALPHTLSGKNTLILAPTGSGKTLAAFLSVLSELGRRELPNAVCAVYVSPLRSLTRDIERNLQPLIAALDGRVRMEVRTGDTPAGERARQQRTRPHLLLTTPESLSTLVSQSGWAGAVQPFAIVVDEIHSFAESKRGSLLALTLERLGPAQRIGLSATASPVDAVERFLCGDRPCTTVSVDVKKSYRLEIAPLGKETKLPVAGFNPYRLAFEAAALVERANCTILFTSTRSAAERLGLALKVILPQWEDDIAVHHGSVDREERLRIEERLGSGTIRAVVCSTSLELGVDFGAVDQVALIGTPRGVSRAVQRLGRSGHRVNGVSEGSIVPLSLPDLLESIALRRAVTEGRMDALRIPKAPLDVLAQVLLGMSIERPWKLDEAFAVVKRAGPYRELPQSDFDSVIEYLSGGGKVLGGYGPLYGKILVEDGKFRVGSKKVARSYYMNAGTISDDYMVNVISGGNRRLGQVEEGFLSGLQPGEAFVMAGKAVRVKRLHQNTALVEAAQGERVVTPRWMGGKLSMSAQLAREELALRQSIRKAWLAGGGEECMRALKNEWNVSKDHARRVVEYVERQFHAAPVPVQSPLQLERVARGRAVLLIFHTVAGRAVNRSLAWVLGYRLGVDLGSVVANFDDHAFLLSLDRKKLPSLERLRECFAPAGWAGDLRAALESTETLGRKFRPIAETGQLLARRTAQGAVGRRPSSWNASLLYQTFFKLEPEHPLLREAVRETLEDDLDAENAARESERIFAAEWEVFDLPRPSLFALPLFAFFNREVLLSQDPDKALEEVTERIYEEWA